jgi:hypothetical protein
VRELISEELLAGKHPIAESEIKDWSIDQEAKGILVELLIIHGGAICTCSATESSPCSRG